MLKDLFDVKFSAKEAGNQKRPKEEAAYLMFIDFLDKCEGIDIFSICDYLVMLTAVEIVETLLIPNSRLEFEETTCTIIPEHILVFSIALDRIPPGGFPVKPKIKFTDGNC